MKSLKYWVLIILISGFVTACVKVDVCRWAITPSVDSVLYHHGYIYKTPSIPKENQPPGSTIAQNRLVSEDKVVDLSVTHLTIPGQQMALVYCGGNGFRQGALAKPLFNAFDPPPNMLIFDYPGYGQSGGEATALEFDQATQILGKHISQWQQTQGFKRIIFWGRSFGGTICARLAGRHPGESSLVLETTYNDLRSLVSSRAGLFKHFFRITIDSDAPDFSIDQALKNYSYPIAILKSKNDPITPPEASEKLAKLLIRSGKSVIAVNMGAVDHKEILFQPCLANAILGRIRPVVGGLSVSTQGCTRKSGY